jgi:hypothetical protein
LIQRVLNTANCGLCVIEPTFDILNTTGYAVEIAKRDLLDAEKDLKEYLNKSED